MSLKRGAPALKDVKEEKLKLKEAAAQYETKIKQNPMKEELYNRLMMIYRKMKNPKAELRTIKKALSVFTSFYDKKAKPFSGNNKLGTTSKALLKLFSGSSRITSYTQYPEPVPKWTLRKLNVEKKLARVN